ncbi:iduronate 2-sulfatase-like [Littorina saxatilis]|uniref:Sulfatase N-terminal domain-containing protein n=1 Tax=Littorina saxatilis TaxID=31220 RepID=A0AAN9B2L1_9CAEN
MALGRLHFCGCLFLVCVFVSGLLAYEKRQIHFTHDPTSPPPTGSAGSQDPLTTWLTRAVTTRPNVLFLIADDLRPKLGCYGESNMVTPNIDQLASQSVRFDRAYVQQAVCGPSRASFLTGRRPDTTRVVDLHTYWRTAGGNFTTLPQYFREHGYVTQGVGKVFHPGISGGNNDDELYSWSAPTYLGVPNMQPENDPKAYHKSTLQPVNVTELGDLQDTDVADFSIDFLRNHSRKSDKPFFLVVGFRKPHLPWRYPMEYTDLYPLSNIQLAPHRTVPPQMPPIAFSTFGELRKFEDIIALNVSMPYGPIPEDYQLKLRQGYSAAVSYTDAELGRVLAALDQSGLTNNTVIAFIGDHGWQLGENAEWSKHTNFEIAVRIPFTIYIPGVTSSNHRFHFIDPLTVPAGIGQAADRISNATHSHSDALVEAVDLFATLTELSGLPVPKTCPTQSRHVPVCTEGTSLLPVIRHVQSSGSSPEQPMQWKKAAFSQFHRNLDTNLPVMGYTVRTDQHRYTEWVAFDKVQFRGNFSHVVARELYVEDSDPDEFHNVAEVTSYSSTVESLSQLLRAGWEATLQNYLVSSGRK